MLEKLSTVLFNPDVIPRLLTEYNDYIAKKSGSAVKQNEALQTELREIERKITNTVNLMIETGSAALKDKLNELEKTKENLLFALAEIKSILKQASVSEENIRELFHHAELQLKNGTLANRRAIIDQYINKVMIYPDRIEVYMNLMNDYMVKEVIDQ